jgi:uncharacterized protein (DUF486 family)
MWTILLLTVSNIFMTFAWYGHLKWFSHGDDRPQRMGWIILLSWGIAFFEYCFQVPANRMGRAEYGFTTAQLKIIQEVITLVVFCGFSVLFLKEQFRWNYVVAFILVFAAVFFVFFDWSRVRLPV